MSRHRPRSRKSPPTASPPGQGERLQKVLAAAGIGSRRECEELIATGRVEVDRRTVTELGTRVDPLQHEIRVDGVSLPRPKRAYYVLNKPAGVVCTNRDPSGRVRAVDLVRSDERLFTVGRLDRTSEGLILITNDGELANQLTHPRYGVEKRYLVRVVGSLESSLCEKLLRGIHLAEGIARVSEIHVRKRTAKFSDVEICLREGKNREIRRILARVGHKVVRLKRIAIGPLRLGMLPVGSTRALTREEVRQLRQWATRPGRRRSEGRRPAARSAAGGTPGQKQTGPPLSGKRRAAPPEGGQRRRARGEEPWLAATGEPLDAEHPPSSVPAGFPPEPEEVEVKEFEMDRPTGSVLAFEASPDELPRSTRKRRDR